MIQSAKIGDLPKNIQKKAIAYCKILKYRLSYGGFNFKYYRGSVKSIPIVDAFEWRSTPEGYDYWREVEEKYYKPFTYDYTLQEIISMVKEFNEKFEIDANKLTKGLRFSLMSEENEEYLTASTPEEEADAIGDQLYILIGTIIKHGLENKIFEVLSEIHRSNMSKLGKDGKPVVREDGKILKGPNYFPPDIKSILNQK